MSATSNTVTALTVRFYFVSLLAFLLFCIFVYVLASALKRSGFLHSFGISTRPNVQPQKSVGSECSCHLRFGSCTRCDTRPSLHRYFDLKRRSNTISLHQSKEETSQCRSSGGDIEAQDDQKANSAIEWATYLLQRMQSLQRRNSREWQCDVTLRQPSLPLATLTFASVAHSSSVATVEKKDNLTLPAFDSITEMDITDILTSYASSQDSFGSVDGLETPPMLQDSIPYVALHGSQEFTPTLREIIKLPLYLSPQPVVDVRKSALASESSPSCVAGTLRLPLKAHARMSNRSGTSIAEDVIDRSSPGQTTPIIGPFVWEVMQAANSITE